MPLDEPADLKAFRRATTSGSTGRSASTRSHCGRACGRASTAAHAAGPSELVSRPDLAGPLPLTRRSTGRCCAGTTDASAIVPGPLLDALRRERPAVVLANIQMHAVVPFIVGARRLGLPIVGHVASWDHTRRQGRSCRPTAALHRAERRDARRPRAATTASSRSAHRRHGLAADRRVPPQAPARGVRGGRCAVSGSTRRVRSSSSWGTRRPTLRTSSGSSNGSSTGGRQRRRLALLAPVPAASARPRSGGSASPRRCRTDSAGVTGSRASPTSRRSPSLLQHGDVVVSQCRHDPARRARQRPADGLRPLRRGSAAGRELGGQERQSASTTAS